MTRHEKINALVNEYLRINKGSFLPEREMYITRALKTGIATGIALRDEELLAMEFDEDGEASRLFYEGAEWYHEQFMKAIKEKI